MGATRQARPVRTKDNLPDQPRVPPQHRATLTTLHLPQANYSIKGGSTSTDPVIVGILVAFPGVDAP